jgi:hypothetical protein
MTTAQIRRDHVDTGDTGWQSGWIIFAAVMMIFGGTMSILQGIVGIAKDDVLVVTRNYAYTFNTTSWGWLHLALGIAVVLAGLGLFGGAVWARVIAVFVVGLAMIANFMWIPYYPVWALALIAIDAFVIWALCTAGSRRKDQLR